MKKRLLKNFQEKLLWEPLVNFLGRNYSRLYRDIHEEVSEGSSGGFPKRIPGRISKFLEEIAGGTFEFLKYSLKAFLKEPVHDFLKEFLHGSLKKIFEEVFKKTNKSFSSGIFGEISRGASNDNSEQNP